MSKYTAQLQATLQYLNGRQNADGGFCFYRYEEWGMSESNVPDTFYALSSLSILGTDIPHRQKVVSFLRACEPPDGLFPSITIAWAFLSALRLLKEKPLISPKRWLQEAIATIEDSLLNIQERQWSGTLVDLTRLLSLCRSYNVACTKNIQSKLKQAISQLKCREGGYGWPGANLLDTWQVLHLHELLHWRPQPSVLQYVRACEHENLGFTLTPQASNATLSVLLAGIYATRLFQKEPLYRDAIERYVMACQTGRGGFAPVPGALADLENTCLALRCLKALRCCISSSISPVVQVHSQDR